MRTVYLGTSEFAATVLDALANSAHRPQLVVTRPDAQRGRGRKLAAPPVADTARLLGIEVFQPEDVNSEEARKRIAALEPETIAHQGPAALGAPDAERAPVPPPALARGRTGGACHRGG
jgi:methionyl-tRNA formyltransferase